MGVCRLSENTICFSNSKIVKFILKSSPTQASGVVVENCTRRANICCQNKCPPPKRDSYMIHCICFPFSSHSLHVMIHNVNNSFIGSLYKNTVTYHRSKTNELLEGAEWLTNNEIWSLDFFLLIATYPQGITGKRSNCASSLK